MKSSRHLSNERDSVRLKKFALAIAISLAAFASLATIAARSVSSTSSNLQLKLLADKTDLKVGEEVKVSASITNAGNWFVRLVSLGDGSESGWRTPIAKWIIHEMHEGEAPKPLSFESLRDCGNINALSLDEIFSLAPGKTKELGDWMHLPPFTNPGKYRVVFSYSNQPSLEWNGVPLGIHNPFAMWLIRNSTQCDVKSNEVYFNISE